MKLDIIAENVKKKLKKMMYIKTFTGAKPMNELVQSIKSFEDVHRKYLNHDGTINNDGWNLLHDAEINWSDDPKYHDYEKYHLQPRLEEYWYDCSKDEEYKQAWIILHPKLAKKYGIE